MWIGGHFICPQGNIFTYHCIQPQTQGAQGCAVFGRMTRGWADSGVSGAKGLCGCTDIPLCVCGCFTDAQGPGLHQERLWAALCPTFSYVTVLHKDLFVPEERSKKLFRFLEVSLVWIFVSIRVCMCVCAWERLNGCCVGVFCLSISLHYVRKQRRLMWFAYYFLAIHEAWSVCQDRSR